MLLGSLFCISAGMIIEDIIAKLGMDQKGAQHYILANFTGGYGSELDVPEHFIALPRIKTLSAIASGDKVGAAKELCEYIRQYCNSEEFAADYAKKRANSKPTYEPERVDEEMLKNGKESLKEMEQQLAEYKNSPNANKEVVQGYEKGVESMRAMVAEWEDPTPNLTKWKRNYPEDPAILVKRKLEQYLALAASVDFNAKLTEPDRYNMKKFAKAEYESKPEEWKACYRAGKEVNNAVAAFVKNWLKGEIISANKVKMPGNTTTENKSGNTPNNGKSDVDASENATTDSRQENAKPEGNAKKSFLGKMKDQAKKIIND